MPIIVDIKENNLNNLYNNKQRFARISPLRGPCKPRVAARETTMNNASPWTRFLLVVLAKLFHFMAPFLAMAKLELGSAHGLSKALYFVVYLAARL